MVEYPSVEKIIELNLLALSVISVKKADQAKVLNKSRLLEVVENCRNFDGDLHGKAIVLLKGIIQKHPFASGNRRTAFLSMKYFLMENKLKLGIVDDPANAKVLQGIRENYYSEIELKEWIKNGKIRKFER